MAEQRLRILPGTGNVSFDARFSKKGAATFTGNVTLTVIGIDPGEEITFWFTQDATGGRTLTITALSGGSNVAVGSSTFNTTASTTTRVSIVNINEVLYVEYSGAGGAAASVAFADVTGKPTTLTGYGITDAIPLTQKGAANGVATLGANTIVPTAQLGTGTANNTTFVRGDQTWDVPA